MALAVLAITGALTACGQTPPSRCALTRRLARIAIASRKGTDTGMERTAQAEVTVSPPGGHRRLQPMRQRRRREILDAATEVFYRRGITVGTVREIATLLGLTEPAIHHYVGSAQDVLAAVTTRVGSELDEALRRGLGSGDTARGRLVGVVEELTSTVRTHRRGVAVYYREQHHLPADVRARIARRDAARVAATAELVPPLQPQDALPAESATLLAQAILAVLRATGQWHTPCGPGAVETAQAIVRLLRLDRLPTGEGPAA